MRGADGNWQRPIIITAGTLEFTPIGATMSLDAIYADTSLG